MKKLLSIIAGTITIGAAAQSSILLSIVGTSYTFAPNSVLYLSTAKGKNVHVILDIKNTSATTKSYNAIRYDVALNAKANSTADAYFCFAGSCYGSFINVSPTPLTLDGFQSASQVPGDNQTLTADLDESTDASGFSHVKYTFINTANSSDSVQISIKYNDAAAVGIKETDKSSFSMAVFPVPAKEKVTLKINSAKSFETKLSVYNSLGDRVQEKPVTLNEGKNSVELSLDNFSAGIYFVSMMEGQTCITKKIIVN